ncbi:MAG: hypothetical protein ABTQ93_16500 [Candidatus Competibacter denitrificans]
MSALDNIRDPVLRAEFESHVTSIYRQAYAAQGRKAFEYPRHSAAIHEAGHAIVYAVTADRVRWWPPYRLRIWREAINGLSLWLGQTDVSPKAPPLQIAATELEATLIYALRLVAGVTAEMTFDGRDFRQSSSVDELVIVGALARNLEEHHWHQPAEYCMALVIATATKLLRAHANTLTALATTLERQRKLQGQDLTRWLQSVQRRRLPTAFDSLSRWQP